MQNIDIGYHKPNTESETHDDIVKHLNSAKFSLPVEAVFFSLLKNGTFPLCEEFVITSPEMVTSDWWFSSKPTTLKTYHPPQSQHTFYSRFINRFKSRQTPKGKVCSGTHRVVHTKKQPTFSNLGIEIWGYVWKYTVRVWDRASLLSIPVRKRPFGGCSMAAYMHLTFLREYSLVGRQ